MKQRAEEKLTNHNSRIEERREKRRKEGRKQGNEGGARKLKKCYSTQAGRPTCLFLNFYFYFPLMPWLRVCKRLVTPGWMTVCCFLFNIQPLQRTHITQLQFIW